jgi:hypothetical protein
MNRQKMRKTEAEIALDNARTAAENALAEGRKKAGQVAEMKTTDIRMAAKDAFLAYEKNKITLENGTDEDREQLKYLKDAWLFWERELRKRAPSDGLEGGGAGGGRGSEWPGMPQGWFPGMRLPGDNRPTPQPAAPAQNPAEGLAPTGGNGVSLPPGPPTTQPPPGPAATARRVAEHATKTKEPKISINATPLEKVVTQRTGLTQAQIDTLVEDWNKVPGNPKGREAFLEWYAKQKGLVSVR